MRQQQERIAQNKIEVLVVTFEDAEQALNYQRETQLHWPVVIDRSRELYTYYGMTKAGFWDLWGPATWWAYLREMFKGNMPKYNKADIHQRGGDILLDPKGMVVMHRVGKGPADRPAVEDILQIVEREERTKIKPEELQKLRN